MADSLKRRIGIFSCVMLVSGNMIGVGIFTTPGVVAKSFSQPWEVILAWVVGGMLTLAGALSFGEMGAMYPEAGGTYIFLREAFGKPCAFISGWIFAVIITPGVIAVLSIGFAAYMGFPAGWSCKVAALGAILVLAGINYRGVSAGVLIQNVTTFGKIAAMLGLAFFPFFFSAGPMPETAPVLGMTPVKSMALALIPIMYTYSGWNAAVLVGGEVENPGRTIPLGLMWGTLLVGVVYISMNMFYLAAVPLVEMRGDLVIAETAVNHWLGPFWAGSLAILIAVSSLGCLNATILTGPRIPYVMAKDGLFFEQFRWVHPRFATPSKAIAFQAGLAMLMVVTGTFDQLLGWVTVPSLLVSLFCVGGLIRLRYLRPEVPRPYRVWGYPWVPLVFILTVSWIVIDNFVDNPMDSLMGLAFIILGIPLYFYWMQQRYGVRSS